MTRTEKKSYYQAVFNVKLRSIINNTKLEDSVIVYNTAQLLNYCDSCKHCKADLNSAELICQSGGNFNYNDISCKRDERQIKPGCYTL
jgi:hypothetical protein